MDDEWVGRSLRLTTVCLAASGFLILPAAAGVGPSPLLAAVVGVLAAGCLAARDQLASLPTVIGYDLGRYAQDLWLAGVLAALVVLLGPASFPEELAALGGVVGLFGMLNYFLRPIYLSMFSMLARWTGG